MEITVSPRFLGKLSVAARLGISRTTLDSWRREDPSFPKPIVFSRFVLRWDIKDIDEWALSRKIQVENKENEQ